MLTKLFRREKPTPPRTREEILFEKFRFNGTPSTPEGCWTNFLGLHTKVDLFPADVERFTGRYISELPINGDGVYGPAAEYAAVLTAIEAKGDDRSSFSAIELGAGWGPWISAAGVVCKRLGFERIHLVGVEAADDKANSMVAHLERNGLTGRVLRGAAWHEDTTVYFPKIAMEDYGGAATNQKEGPDYRGSTHETVAVPAFSLQTICQGLDRVDFAHWDVAGAELPIAERSKDFLNAKFSHLFIGTHSRKIEGDLLELFHQLGWDLLHFDPCHFQYDRAKPTVVSMTLNDGCMLWRNPRLN